MPKKHRKSIRIDGRLVTKEFTTAEAAKSWYSQLHSKKVMGDFNLPAPKTKGGLLFKDYALGEFMDLRRAGYPASTWKADEQRLNDHIVPAIGNVRLDKLTGDKIRAFLAALVTKKGLSPKTRDRVQALISIIYAEALNREGGALVQNNPTYGLAFRRGKRTGNKAPSYLHTSKDVFAYLKAARDLGPLHFGVAGLGVGGGLRKQEMIPLRVECADFITHILTISEKYIQASGEIVRGTKAGDECERYVPMSEMLESALLPLCEGAASRDFILRHKDGSHLSPRTIYTLGQQICARAGVKVTVHGLRHTFGREFAQRSGNMNALMDILGHSNFATTKLYSSLGKERLKGFRGVMDFDLNGQE